MPYRLFTQSRIFLALLGAALLTGCSINSSQVPMAATYPYSEQRKMQAAHHWEVLAAYEAERIMRSARLDGQPLFVSQASQDSPFARGFGSMLVTHLVANGALVRTEPIGAAQVDYQVQVVEHDDRDFIRPPRGALTTIATGIAVATWPINHWSEPALALVPAAAGVDALSGGWAGVTDKEVIVTTQVIDVNRVLYSSSNVYYINPEDEAHYRDESTFLKTIPVTNRW
ncbi:hypothetical protein DFO67_104257 [Modicisalibacter xianhensis]|uniref:DUF4823 domain-containing protein n=1 Tax=Modicisalibacter xianhensis TaxID=442341 RepID=A0A4R8FVV9_9GAMM|nr:hypothetical protein [Halomonas xianhensis]TDX30992.1 hypothetical protein DFO67_104257 [Halomonas xianhensis]